MGLLRDIQNAAIATDQPLALVLRKARVLAARLDHEPLRQWTSHELNGYPPEATLPAYRARRQTVVKGTFAGPFGQRVDNLAIPRLAVDKDYWDGPLFNFAYQEPVAAYEEILRAPQREDLHLKSPWPADALVVVRPRVLEGMECVAAWQVLPRGEVVAVVEGVRNRLLEFVLELEREAPQAEDEALAELAGSQERVTQIFTTTIYAGTTMNDQSINVQGGTTGNIAGGRGNTTEQGDVLITQSADLTPLLEQLRAAVAQLPPGEAATTRGLVDALEKEAAAEQPRRQRMLDLLKGVGAVAATAGSAGVAVIDAAQAIGRALGG